MSLKKSLQKVGEWVEDVGKFATGTIKGTLEKGALRDTLEDFAGIGGPIGIVFKIASRQIPEPTAEQLIASELSTTFFNQVQKARTEHPELCQVDTWETFAKGDGATKANELLGHEFSWLSLYGRSGLRTSRSWPLVGELADVAEAWFSGATRADGRLTLESRRIIDAIRGSVADALAETVEKVLQKPEVQLGLQQAREGLGRQGLELLAEELSTLRRTRLFGEVPQDELFIPPRIKCLDFDKPVPKGKNKSENEIDWSEVPDAKGADPVRAHITPDRPRLVVLFGDMGAGKSCLMRVLVSEVAEQYLLDKKQPAVFVRWREIYQNPNLLEAVAEQVRSEYGLPADDLTRQERVAYFIDGFDEMSSHQNEVVWQLFLKLAKFVELGHTVVVAMRSAVVTTNIQTEWRERRAFVIRVSPFEKDEVNAWAIRWQMRTTDVTVTSERLQELADEEVTANPLLLYMLARYVHPLAVDGERMSRAEVFRTFVDETVSGKLQKSNESFGLPPDTKDGYRLLLQEMAYLASWPKSNGKCSEALLKEMLTPDVCEKLRFKDVRTAFVLHFFDPGDVRQNEFEFQPEGFRQYLLAEWCTRALLEVHQDSLDFKPGPFRRKRDDAMQALAQFPLREVERGLLDELVTELGKLARTPDRLEARLRAFGFARKSKAAVELVNRLLRGLWADGVTPPSLSWKAANVGIPEGQTIPDCLDSLRLLVNYWDQCLMGYFGLSRGLSAESPVPAPDDGGNIDIGRFFRLRAGVRGHTWETGFDLSRQNFSGMNAVSAFLFRASLAESNLSYCNFINSILALSNMQGILLLGADLGLANLSDADLTGADLTGADLTGANLTGANLSGANLSGANLTGANLSGAILTRANLTGADLTRANLTNAILTDAILTDAILTNANLTDAIVEGTILPKEFKLPSGTFGVPFSDEDAPPSADMESQQPPKH